MSSHWTGGGDDPGNLGSKDQRNKQEWNPHRVLLIPGKSLLNLYFSETHINEITTDQMDYNLFSALE